MTAKIIVLCILAFCATEHVSRAAMKPRASIQKVSTNTRRNPVTDKKQLAISIRMQKKGDYFGVLRAHFEIMSDNETYFGTIGLKSGTSYGESYSTITDLYVSAGENPKLIAYWVGYYYVEGEDEYLLGSKDDNVPDLNKWLQRMADSKSAIVTDGGTQLYGKPQ